MFSLFGFTGQYVYSMLDREADTESAKKVTWAQWMGSWKWSPFSVLDDSQYDELLREKMLKVDVELSLLEEKIAELKKTGSANATVAESKEQVVVKTLDGK